MKFHVMTLFPEMIMNGLNTSILGRAAQNGLISFHTVNFRDYTLDKHGKVDDYPYGGGAGMLIRAQPVFDAYKSIVGQSDKKIRTIYLTPQGRTFNQDMARELAKEEELIFLCGHYEGVDERVLDEIVTDYVSIGDYVLTGGELPVMVMIDAISRMIPGVLNNEVSGETETFHNDLLEYPQYTRPEVWHEKSVPPVLLTGNHKEISKWRLEQSIERTKEKRPDLYKSFCKKQEIIKRLSKNKRLHIHIMECLKRSIGKIVYEKGLNLMVACEDVLMIHGETEEETRIMLQKVFDEKPERLAYRIITTQEFVNHILENEYGFDIFLKCRQACYTRNVSLPVRHKNIRSLDISFLEEIQSIYHEASAEDMEELLEKGLIFGAFEDDKLIGFIAAHTDGSMGKLFVAETYRGKGLGTALESYLINIHLSKGEIPYCQIEEENLILMHLQEKLGLYFSETGIFWLHKYYA